MKDIKDSITKFFDQSFFSDFYCYPTCEIFDSELIVKVICHTYEGEFNKFQAIK